MSDRHDRPTDGSRRGGSGNMGGGTKGGSGNQSEGGEFQRAVGRLEVALEELLTTASEQLSDSAIQIVEDTTARLRGMGGRNRGDGRGMDDRQEADATADDTGSRRSRRQQRREQRDRSRFERRAARWQRRQERWLNGWNWQWEWSSNQSDDGDSGSDGRLYRKPDKGWFGGVCAGLADYFDMEPWVVRLIAVSLLLFTPMTVLVFSAYVVAWCVLRTPDRARRQAVDTGSTDAEAGSARGSGGRPSSRRRKRAGSGDADPHRPSAAPELGPRFSPRHSLRKSRAQFDTVELKLRRMESFVTSSSFELERELARMDGAR